MPQRKAMAMERMGRSRVSFEAPANLASWSLQHSCHSQVRLAGTSACLQPHPITVRQLLLT